MEPPEVQVEYRIFAEGLRFPEGPVCLRDGSLLVCEIEAQRVSRISPAGAIESVATVGGGPNGLAIGPDGQCLVCNNGGVNWRYEDGRILASGMPRNYSGGRLERIDLRLGTTSLLSDRSDAGPLRGPNDLVFDREGGCWFTDTGKQHVRYIERGGVYYLPPGGGTPREAIFPLLTPNGIGLSAAEDRLYVAETITGRIWAFDLEGPGQVARHPGAAPRGGALLTTIPGNLQLDSLAIDGEGNICVAALVVGGIFVVSPDGQVLRHLELPDPSTTNIAFGSPDLRQAYVTLSQTGRVAVIDWPCRGLPLNFSGL